MVLLTESQLDEMLATRFKHELKKRGAEDVAAIDRRATGEPRNAPIDQPENGIGSTPIPSSVASFRTSLKSRCDSGETASIDRSK